MTLGGRQDQQVPDDVLEDLLASLDSTELMTEDTLTKSHFVEHCSEKLACGQLNSVHQPNLAGYSNYMMASPPSTAAFDPNLTIKQEVMDSSDMPYNPKPHQCQIPETVNQFYDSATLPTTYPGVKLENTTSIAERSFSLTELDSLLNNTTDSSFYDENSTVMNSSNCDKIDQRDFFDLNMVKSEPEFVACDFNSGYDVTLPYEDEQSLKQLQQNIPIDLLKQVKSEIDQTCAITNIPERPELWSIDDVQRWITYTLHHYQLPLTHVDNFRVDGSQLVLFSEDDFQKRSPEGGITLYAQLEIWLNALAICHDIEAVVPIPKPNLMYMNLDQTTSIPIPRQPGLVSSPSTSTISSDSTMDSDVDSMRRDSLSSQSTESDSGFCNPEEDGIKQNIHLWQFLKDLLLQPQFYGNCIRWLDRKNGIFKIEDSARVARLWGKRKNRPAMNYDKLSRSIRQYYKKGIIKKTEHSKRLIYRFCHPYLL